MNQLFEWLSHWGATLLPGISALQHNLQAEACHFGHPRMMWQKKTHKKQND